MKNAARVYVLSADWVICEQKMLSKPAEGRKNGGPLARPFSRLMILVLKT